MNNLENMASHKFLEITFDKFIFKVATDRSYSREGLWVLQDGNHIRIGISDFLQQRSGDIAFVEIKPVGSLLTPGDEVTVIETIKVNISLTCPVTGAVVEVNPLLDVNPEVINKDPFGDGWLAVMEAKDWENDRQALLDAQAYFNLMIEQAGQELGK